MNSLVEGKPFLSIQAQDFIEDKDNGNGTLTTMSIPEHSSSGLH